MITAAIFLIGFGMTAVAGHIGFAPKNWFEQTLLCLGKLLAEFGFLIFCQISFAQLSL